MKRRTIIPLSIALVTLVVGVVGYAVTLRALLTLQQESFLLAEEIREAAEEEIRLERAQETLAVLLSQESVVAEWFVSDDTLVDFLEQIERAGSNTGARVSVVSVGADEKAKVYNIHVSVSGGFRAVMRAIGAIETLPVLIKPTQATLETIVREERDVAEWTASLSFAVTKQ